METFIEKIGLYDLVGVLLSGAIAIVSMEVLLRRGTIIELQKYEHSWILFLIISYIIGLVLQESSSIIDRVFLEIRETPKRNYIYKNNNVIKNEKERERYLGLLIKEYGKAETDITEKDMEDFYYKIVSVLETNNLDAKIKRISSLYGSARSLAFFYMYMCLHMYYKDMNNWYICLVFTFLFFMRTYRFAKMKVRVTLRHYYALKKDSDNKQKTHQKVN